MKRMAFDLPGMATQCMLASWLLWAACAGAQVPALSGGVTTGAAVVSGAPAASLGVQAVLPDVSSPVSAQSDAPMSASIQARWDHIAAELRCLVCQNESLASSNAELAVDLRREVRSLLRAGS